MHIVILFFILLQQPKQPEQLQPVQLEEPLILPVSEVENLREQIELQDIKIKAAYEIIVQLVGRVSLLERLAFEQSIKNVIRSKTKHNRKVALKSKQQIKY